MMEVLMSVGIFTGLMMLLVLAVLVARSLLAFTGEVEIRLNDHRTIRSRAGHRLLGVLHGAGILIPAACGGAGTCGLCRVQVTHGARAPLSIEIARLRPEDLAQGDRLACQYTLRDDLRIRLGEEILGARVFSATVRSRRQLGSIIAEITLELPPDLEFEFEAGCFVQVTAPPYRRSFREFGVEPLFRAEWDRLGLWRHEASSAKPTTRAYSLANHPGEKGILTLLVRLAIPPFDEPPDVPPGVVSSFLFGLAPGEQISVSGPYGDFKATDGDREMVLIGGGVGMAPLRSIIFDQLVGRGSKRRVSLWYGTRNRREILYAPQFDALQSAHPNFSWSVALSDPAPDDGWPGARGLIHMHLLESYLRHHPAPQDCEYYLCGPPLMIQAVRAMLHDIGVAEEDIRFDDFGG